MEEISESSILKSLPSDDLPPEIFDCLSSRTRITCFIGQGSTKIKV